MNGLLMRIRAALMLQYDWLIRRNFSFRMNEAALLLLDDVRLFRPTADAGTMLRLDSVFDNYLVDHLSEELQRILRKLIISRESDVPDFDFTKIETLTASKGFGKGYIPQINGSWYRDLSLWGRGMYPGENLRSETLQDWERNVQHIEGEGFRTDDPINVMYYEWYERYVVSNTGGSHHAAKVIYQAIRDKFLYKRNAVVERLSIDSKAVRELEDSYVSFIYQARRCEATGNRRDSATDFYLALNGLVSEHIEYLDPIHYCDNIKLAFVPRSGMKANEALFSEWINTATLAGKIISLTDYLKNPEPFHVKPYLHEVNCILQRSPFESESVNTTKWRCSHN